MSEIKDYILQYPVLGDWEKIDGLILKDDPSAQVDAADGKITLSAPREELILNFPAVEVEINFKMSKKLELFVEPMQREILFYFLPWASVQGKCLLWQI